MRRKHGKWSRRKIDRFKSLEFKYHCLYAMLQYESGIMLEKGIIEY